MNNSGIVCAKLGMILVLRHNTVVKSNFPFRMCQLSDLGSALIKCGHCHQKLGQAHKEFIQSAATGFTQPLKSYLEGEMKSLTVNLDFTNHHLMKDFLVERTSNTGNQTTRSRCRKIQEEKDENDEYQCTDADGGCKFPMIRHHSHSMLTLFKEFRYGITPCSSRIRSTIGNNEINTGWIE